MKNFDEASKHIVEQYSMKKKVVRERYPSHITFSEDFLGTLTGEIDRMVEEACVDCECPKERNKRRKKIIHGAHKALKWHLGD